MLKSRMRRIIALGLLCLVFLAGCGGNGTSINFDDVVGDWYTEINPPISTYTDLYMDIHDDGFVYGFFWYTGGTLEFEGELDNNGEFEGMAGSTPVSGTIRPSGTDRIEADLMVGENRVNVLLPRGTPPIS